MSKSQGNISKDPDLLKLQSRLLRECRLSLFEQGFAPWAKMETELYSVGRCIREITGYSRFFPIFLSGDHGVSLGNTRFWTSEKDNAFGAYLTSSIRKYELLKNKYNVNVIHIKHPWIAWLEYSKITKNEMGRGVLVFLPHSTIGVRYTEESFKEYLHQLNKIPKEYGQISLCISYYDINSTNLQLIYNLGFEVLTAGNPRSVNLLRIFMT